jgi:ABC-type transport system involved in multi-copper enzyme maturation permease subunit
MTGFARVLRAEWTKFTTVPGWVAAVVAATLAMVLVSALSALSERQSCGAGGCAAVPVGPDGEAVADSYSFVHQPLTGDGSITVRVASLTGLLPPSDRVLGGPRTPLSSGRPGVVPWAKAGLLVAAGTGQGASYAAVMVTGDHGVRLQYDYVHDVAGSAGAAAPRWLRLTRAADTLTGEESTDGTHWMEVGAARLRGLPATVQAGLFVTSPQDADVTERPFVTQGAVGPTLATGVFDHVGLRGSWPADGWRMDDVGGPGAAYPALPGGLQRAGDTFTVTGSGDIAPQVAGVESVGVTIDHSLGGGFVALIVVIVLGALFVTSEYRRGLIRTTIAASPQRGQVLLAKAVVIGFVTFVAGLAAAALSVPLGVWILEANNNAVYPVSAVTEVRVIAGTAGLLALAAVGALAVGAIVRRSAVAATAVIVALVLPYLFFPALPTAAAEWVLRVTPAAAFAIQQTLPVYPQVANVYTPVSGYYPLSPWAGFAVLCAYAGLALAVAIVLLRRRDV